MAAWERLFGAWRSGFDVVACDIAPQMLEAFDEPKTAREADPIVTVCQVKTLVICVRTYEQLEAFAGDGALFSALGDGGLIILHSIAPNIARFLATKAKESGVDFLDVGVSGGGPAVL